MQSNDRPLRLEIQWKVKLPRIHGELPKLGFDAALAKVSKYMTQNPTRPDQAG